MKFSQVLPLALVQAPSLLASAVPRSEGELFARDCWFGADVGCSAEGWCWKTCDASAGTWCYTAQDGETCTGCGEWVTCSQDSDCTTDFACAADDPTTPGTCEDCGCGC